MLRWLKSDRKAQFFIISILIVIANLSAISFLYSSYSSADVAQVFKSQESYTFWNIQKEINATVKNNPCPGLDKKLTELRNMAEKEVKSRGIDLKINYKKKCPEPVIEMNLTSDDKSIYDEWEISPV